MISQTIQEVNSKCQEIQSQEISGAVLYRIVQTEVL